MHCRVGGRQSASLAVAVVKTVLLPTADCRRPTECKHPMKLDTRPENDHRAHRERVSRPPPARRLRRHRHLSDGRTASASSPMDVATTEYGKLRLLIARYAAAGGTYS